MVYTPDEEETFECFVDADFCGSWDKEAAMDDPDTARSRSGHVILYAGCPILWTSKMQSIIALSTTEAEYIALSEAIREVIPIMELMVELQARGVMHYCIPQVKCTVFEDNSGAVELANVPKMRPCTKHINIRYHHFRQWVDCGKIVVQQVTTEDQAADMLTKPLALHLFRRHRQRIQGW